MSDHTDRDDVDVDWEAVRRAVAARATRPPSIEMATALASVLQRINHQATPNNAAHPRIPAKSRNGWMRIGLGIGAAAIMAAIGAGVWRAQSPTPVASTSYVTRPGQRATLTLTDGSRAELGPATMVSVASDERTHGTAVTITGEARFTVTHRANRPFTVYAGHTVSRVLGTVFSVRRYATDPVTRIVVADGRVAIGARSTAIPSRVLGANMLGVVSDSGQVTVTSGIAINDYNGLGERLVFRSTPMADILTDLGRVYDVQIRLADSSFAHRKLTLTVPVAHRSIEDVADLLATMLQSHYTKSGNVITIVPGRPLPGRSKSFTSESQYGK